MCETRGLGFTWAANNAFLGTSNSIPAFYGKHNRQAWCGLKGRGFENAKRPSSRCIQIEMANLDGPPSTQRSETSASSSTDVKNVRNATTRPANKNRSPSSSPPSQPDNEPESMTESESDSNSDLSESSQPQEGPLYNSTLLSAMRDYFGDDGREVQDYMKRPRNSSDQVMLRVVIAGNSPTDEQLASKLYESGVMRGLYYCGDGLNEDRIIVVDDDDDEDDIHEEAVRRSQVKGMQRYADLVNEGEQFSVQGVVKFATWCVADAVFIGSDCNEDFGRQVEADLAEAGVTVFAHDVGKAIANGELSVVDCLSTLMRDDSVEEALLE